MLRWESCCDCGVAEFKEQTITYVHDFSQCFVMEQNIKLVHKSIFAFFLAKMLYVILQIRCRVQLGVFFKLEAILLYFCCSDISCSTVLAIKLLLSELYCHLQANVNCCEYGLLMLLLLYLQYSHIVLLF